MSDGIDDPLGLTGLYIPNPAETGCNPENVVLNTEEDFSQVFITEVKMDEENYVALENKIDDAILLLSTMKQANGMCANFALEAQKIFPDFGGVPIGYYSRFPSATRFSVAFESLTNAMIALIAAAAAAIITLIYKLYKWITGSGDDDDTPTIANIEKKFEQQAELVSVVDSAVKDVSNDVLEADRLLKGKRLEVISDSGKVYQCLSFQTFIDNNLTDENRYAKIKQYLEFRDPLLRDILNKGTYSQTCYAAAEIVEQLTRLLVEKSKIIDEVLVADSTVFDPASPVTNKYKLSKFEDTTTVHFMSKQCTLKDISDILHEAKSKLHTGSEGYSNIPFDRFMTTIYNLFEDKKFEKFCKVLAKATVLLDDYKEKLEKFEKFAKNISSDGMPGAPTDGVGEGLRAALRVIRSDVTAMAFIIANLNEFMMKTIDLYKTCTSVCEEVIVKLTSELHRNKQEIPEGWHEIMMAVKVRRADMVKAHREARGK